MNSFISVSTLSKCLGSGKLLIILFRCLFLADFNDVLTQRSRNDASFLATLQSLRPCFRTSWRCRMARRTVLTHRLELWLWMVRPDVCRLHPALFNRLVQFVLAICNGVAGKTLHPCHLPHTAPWIFDEPVFRFQSGYQFKNVLIDRITELRIFADRIKVSCHRVLSSVVTDCRNAERGAVR